MSLTSTVPAFVRNGSRFDVDSFIGRLNGVVVQFDPLKLLASDAELEAAIKLLELHGKGEAPAGTSDEQLWHAQELLSSRLHPDTQEPIPLPLCFAAYTPMQPPIILGMLWPGGSVLNQAFWQISNQGYNAAVFFANKNKSSEVDDSEVMMSTAGSIAAALALSIGAVKLGDVSGNAAIRSSAGFVGCVGAGWASLVMMRKDELQNGVNVVDDEGTVHGKSKTAAREGIAKCAASRVVWNLPATGITPFLCAAYTKSAMNKAMPMMNLPATTAIITCGIIAGVYPGQALFTQQARIDAASLEPEFQDCRTSSGAKVTEFTYNKGL